MTRQILNLLSNSLVILGICIQIGALVPVRRLINQLPPGSVRRRWYLMTILILVFILGYFTYIVIFWGKQALLSDLVVPGIFFLGAGFVWLTATLSLQTAINIRRVTLLEYENITDPLIGIYNRRYLDRRLEEEFTRARRYNLNLSLLLLDIDRFKRVNDTYGHQVGDLVLNYLGKLVLQAVRESDIVARYGGEELLIIAPNTTVHSAAILAERLRQHIETHELVITGKSNKNKSIRVTVSIGISGLEPEMPDCQGLVYKADEALYQAKQDGRNRVSIYEGGLPPSPSQAT